MTNRDELIEFAKKFRETKIDFNKDGEMSVEHEKLLIAGKIKAYRVIYKLTQEDLAKKLGVPKLQIIRWEGGKHMPNTLAMAKLRSEGVI